MLQKKHKTILKSNKLGDSLVAFFLWVHCLVIFRSQHNSRITSSTLALKLFIQISKIVKNWPIDYE